MRHTRLVASSYNQAERLGCVGSGFVRTQERKGRQGSWRQSAVGEDSRARVMTSNPAVKRYASWVEMSVILTRKMILKI
jgi:hypothetical protein